jgi:hypothetical protein
MSDLNEVPFRFTYWTGEVFNRSEGDSLVSAEKPTEQAGTDSKAMSSA